MRAGRTGGTAGLRDCSPLNPDSAQCALLAQTQGQRNTTLPLIAGGKVCLTTDEGRTALVTVATIHPQAQNASLDVRIWQKTD